MIQEQNIPEFGCAKVSKLPANYWIEQEKERGITITSAAVSCQWNFPTVKGKADAKKGGAKRSASTSTAPTTI